MSAPNVSVQVSNCVENVWHAGPPPVNVIESIGGVVPSRSPEVPPSSIADVKHSPAEHTKPIGHVPSEAHAAPGCGCGWKHPASPPSSATFQPRTFVIVSIESNRVAVVVGPTNQVAGGE